MSGNVTTAGDVNVMPGGTLRVAKTTIGGNLENGGTVQMNSEGGKPGNVLTVNGNYTGNSPGGRKLYQQHCRSQLAV